MKRSCRAEKERLYRELWKQKCPIGDGEKKKKGLWSDQIKEEKTRQEQEKESQKVELLPERTEEPRRRNNIAQMNMERIWSNKIKGYDRWRRN
jgi:hypothetical protein